MALKTQLSVFLENRPGALAKVGRAFTEAEINILAISVSDTVDHAVMRFIVDDTPKAVRILEEANVLVMETGILEVELPNKPGSLANFAARLATQGINIDYAYGSVHGSADRTAVLYLRVSDLERAEGILAEYLKEQ